MLDGFSLKQAIDGLLVLRPEIGRLPTWEQAAKLRLSPYKWVNYRLGRRGEGRLEVVLFLAKGFGVDVPTVLRLGGMKEKYLQPAQGLTITKRRRAHSPTVRAISGGGERPTELLQCELEQLSEAKSKAGSLVIGPWYAARPTNITAA